MATTDIYTVLGSVFPVRAAVRGRGNSSTDGIQVDTLAAAMVAGNDTIGTITAWIMVPDDTGTYTIFGAGDANAVEYMHFSVEAGTLWYMSVDSGPSTRVDTNTTNKCIKPHTWHHVALVQDGAIPRFYVDGVLQARTDTTATELSQWFDDLDNIDGGHIGAADSVAGGAALSQEWKGYISDVKIWSGTTAAKALTREELLLDMAGASTTETPTASYNMNFNVINQANPGTYNGTKTATMIYVDGNNFASKLTFNPTFTAVAADYPNITISQGVGFAIMMDAA